MLAGVEGCDCRSLAGRQRRELGIGSGSPSPPCLLTHGSTPCRRSEVCLGCTGLKLSEFPAWESYWVRSRRNCALCFSMKHAPLSASRVTMHTCSYFFQCYKSGLGYTRSQVMMLPGRRSYFSHGLYFLISNSSSLRSRFYRYILRHVLYVCFNEH